MGEPSWRSSESFGVLCDQVASDHLVCLTGAGISRGLRRKDDPGRTLPGWIELLRELFVAFKPEMSKEDAESVDRLLNSAAEKPGSDELILAASLIRRDNRKEFDRRFREAITEAPGQSSDTHAALLRLKPRGIVTFNYDRAHETACDDAKLGYLSLNPTVEASEAAFREMIEGRLRRFFVLKAHGSIDSPSPLVLTTEEYRNLMVKNPAFRAFVQNLFTNFSFLIVGYGLDDPDFDLFTRTMAEQFGAPVQKHVVLRKAATPTPREEVERHLYGIHSLRFDDYGEIPEVLEAAATTAGPELEKTLAMCLSRRHEERVRGHEKLRGLGAAGRELAGNVLLGHLSDPDSFDVAEAAYSLGVIDAKHYKDRLFELVDARSEADVLGRALTVLRQAFELGDVPRLQEWRDRFAAAPPTGERAERIVKYLEYLVLYVEHKFKSDPGVS
jgi:hypothetical protein